jgi:hypothetical protein
VHGDNFAVLDADGCTAGRMQPTDPMRTSTLQPLSGMHIWTAADTTGKLLRARTADEQSRLQNLRHAHNAAL